MEVLLEAPQLRVWAPRRPMGPTGSARSRTRRHESTISEITQPQLFCNLFVAVLAIALRRVRKTAGYPNRNSYKKLQQSYTSYAAVISKFVTESTIYKSVAKLYVY